MPEGSGAAPAHGARSQLRGLPANTSTAARGGSNACFHKRFKNPANANSDTQVYTENTG